jgi:hypothetical protein
MIKYYKLKKLSSLKPLFTKDGTVTAGGGNPWI